MDFNTALVIALGIISVTVLALSLMGTIKDYKLNKQQIEIRAERERRARIENKREKEL